MTKYKWINRWIICDLENLHFFAALFCVIVYLAGLAAESTLLKQAGYLGSLILILLFFLHKNLHAQYEFLKLHEKIDHLPVEQMKQVNAFFMSLFLGLTAVLLLSVWMLPIQPVLLAILRSIVFIIRQIVGLFDFGEKKEADMFLDEAVGNGGMPDLGTMETTWITRVLDFLMEVIGYILLALLIWYLLRILYQRLCRLFRPRVFDDDEKVFLTPQVSTKFLSGRGRKRKERELWSDFSYNGRVRKTYMKTIRKYNAERKKIPPSASPKEIESFVGVERKEIFLHQLYEKARYSEKGCDKREWMEFEERFKKNIRK